MNASSKITANNKLGSFTPELKQAERNANAKKALNTVTDSLRTTPEGQRNAALNTASHWAGRMVAADRLPEGLVRDDLWAAANSIGLNRAEFDATFKSGFEAGLTKPMPDDDSTYHDYKRQAFMADPVETALSQKWPTPYDAFDGSALPPREWVYGRDYIKKYISVTASAGGLGKTSLTIAETLSMVTGKPLLGITPKQKEKVWLINLEDPRQELERRTIAAMQHYCLQPDEVRGNLFMDGEDTMNMTLAMESRDGFVQNDALLQFMIGKINENAIGVVIIDPFVSAHLVNENNNGSIQAVVSMLRQLARDTNTAVQLVHHIRKTNGEDATIDSVRGAGSLIGAARAARVINRIKPEDAMELGVEEHEALGIFRVDDGKSNLLPPADKAIYRRMKSVQIGNGENIGVAIEFKLPDAFDGVTRRHLYNLQRVLGSADDKDDAEQAYRENVQADNWVGKAVAEEVGLDLEQAHEKARVKKMLKAWIRSGALKIVKLPQKSKDRDAPCVVVGEWVNHDEI